MIYVTPSTLHKPCNLLGGYIGLVLRRHGLIPSDIPTLDTESAVFLVPQDSNAPLINNKQAMVIEGPLCKTALTKYDIQGKQGKTQKIAISGGNATELEMFYKHINIRHHTYRNNRPVLESRPGTYDLGTDDGLICYTKFEPVNGWTPVLEGTVDDSNHTVILAVTKENITLIGFPIFHMLSASLGWPALESGYYSYDRYNNSQEVEDWLIKYIKTLAKKVKAPLIEVSPWPKGFNWTVLVRHDYDRLITDAEFQNQINFYSQRSLRPNWFFLPHKLIEHQAQWLLKEGHEVALHTTAKSETEFNSQSKALSRVLGRQVIGVTAHGGDYPGFLGDNQYAWAQNSGMTYSESMGASYGYPFVGTTLRNHRPNSINLINMPSHVSLDAGTKEHQHNFELCIRLAKHRRKEGAALQLMNHPDVHTKLLQDLIDSVNIKDAWLPTMPELANWSLATRFGINAVRQKNTIELTCKLPRAADVLLTIQVGNKSYSQTWQGNQAKSLFKLRSMLCV